MELLFFVGVAIMVTYLIISIVRFGIPLSISDTHYLWYNTGNVFAKGAFAFVLMSTAMCVCPMWVDMSTLYTQWLAFLGAGALAFVGSACAFEEEMTHTVHYASAYTWASVSVIWSVITVGTTPLIIGGCVALVGLGVQRFRNRTFWLEIGAIVTLLLSLLVRRYFWIF